MTGSSPALLPLLGLLRTGLRTRLLFAAVAAAATLTLVPLAQSASLGHAEASAASSTARAGDEIEYCEIRAKSAVIRSAPRTSATALGTAYAGQKCIVLDAPVQGEGRWVKLKMNKTGVTGYVRSDLVDWVFHGLQETGR